MTPKDHQTHAPISRRIYSVSELTAEIRALLEKTYPFVWVSGEISNIRIPASGHFYFTLKDPDAQIQALMFRGQNRNLEFLPEDGMLVTGFGRLSVYPPRGSYQIILEYLEPSGAGALQAAFEQLKRRLSEEGLFDERHKKPIPYLPAGVAVISSATGAVVHDIIRVVHRRFPNMPVAVIPASVQGEGAEAEIIAALGLLNRQKVADVAILARGGGSLEDLAAFNSEGVARAIFASEIPVISAVGHETDYTIADFTADLRAPTPSAAAELAVPVKQDVSYTLQALTRRLHARMSRQVAESRHHAEKLARRLVHPSRRIDDLKLRLDDDHARLVNAACRIIRDRRERLAWRRDRLLALPLCSRIQALRDSLAHVCGRLRAAAAGLHRQKRTRLETLCARLHALSPAAVLERGYSITRTLPDRRILSDAGRTEAGKKVEVILAKGHLTCRIERKHEDGKKDF